PHQAERLTEALTRAGVDALVATTPANVAYVSGFRGLNPASGDSSRFALFSREGTALVLPADDVAAMSADPLDVDHVVCFGECSCTFPQPEHATTRRVHAVLDARVARPADALAAALEQLGIRRGSAGLDERGLGHEEWERLTVRLGGIDVVPAAQHLATARRVKAPYEIESLAHALRIAEEALDVVIQTLDRGMSERDAATLYATEALKRGAWPRPAVVAMADHTAIPTPRPTDRALRKGDLVRFDVGCRYKGYHGRVGRIAVLGDPTPIQESTARALHAGMDA